MKLIKRFLILSAMGAVALLPGASSAYGSPPEWLPPAAGPPAWTHAADPPMPTWSPLVRLASAAGGSGVVQGHVGGHGSVTFVPRTVTVRVSAYDGQSDGLSRGTLLWEHEVTADENGDYSVTDAPATAHGWIDVSVDDGVYWNYYSMGDLVFADPGTSTYNVDPAVVQWQAIRGGPWAAAGFPCYPHLEIAGYSPAGKPVYAYTERQKLTGLFDGAADALPSEIRLIEFSFRSDEAALWDAADNFGVPITLNEPDTRLPAMDEATAYRTWFTNSFWYSGKPGTRLRLALKNFEAGMNTEYYGYSDSPDGLETTWNDKRYTSTGLQQQDVAITIPTTATPGYDFHVQVYEPVLRYGIYCFALDLDFQVCTLSASNNSIPRGRAVRLSGVVPVQDHWGDTPGLRKYVWIYKRITAATAAPRAWDATRRGWTLVARVRTDGYGRYHSPWLKPQRSTWYVARYAGDDWYWGAYTSVVKVRVRL